MRLSPRERQRILDLAEDLPALWQAPTTTPAERKQLRRRLLKDVTPTKEATTIRAALRWPTEVGTVVEVPRPPRPCEARRTPAAVVARIRVRAADPTDEPTADRLNAAGSKSGRGGAFTASKVQWVRYAHPIRSGCPKGPAACQQAERGDGRCPAQAAAKALDVDVSPIAAWCKSGRLDGIQAAGTGRGGFG